MVFQDMSSIHLSFFTDVAQICNGKIALNGDTIVQLDPSGS